MMERDVAVPMSDGVCLSLFRTGRPVRGPNSAGLAGATALASRGDRDQLPLLRNGAMPIGILSGSDLINRERHEHKRRCGNFGGVLDRAHAVGSKWGASS